MEALIKSVKIAGMHAAVPSHRHSYLETPDFLTQEEAEKLLATTGIHSRRILPKHLCASDMCVAATEALLQQLDWDPASIEVLIFVTQDADYSLPATACLMQQRLGLPNSAACFDVNLGCSGFIYGVWIASQLLNHASGKRALVLCGDTSSRHLMPTDRSTCPIFGDAGAATALEFDPHCPDAFAVFGTDGSGAAHITIPAGGRRQPVMRSPVPPSEMQQAELFEASRLHLNGHEVFLFTLRTLPALIKQTLTFANLQIGDLDMCVMHQANAFILEHLRKKLKIEPSKFLIDMADFGNTSSASVPLAMCHQLHNFFGSHPKKMLLSGFGVGWSWGALICDIGNIPLGLTEIEDDFQPLALV